MTDFAPRFTISNRIAAALTTIERARGFLEAATLTDEWVLRMSQRALLVEAHATTHIEGTELTLAQAELVWAGETPGLEYPARCTAESHGASSVVFWMLFGAEQNRELLMSLLDAVLNPAVAIEVLRARRTLQRDWPAWRPRASRCTRGKTNHWVYRLKEKA